MYSRLVIFLLLVMVACLDMHVWAQDNSPANGAQLPSLENLPRLLPPPVPPPPPQLTPPSTPPPSTPPGTFVAGKSYKEANTIFKKYKEELKQLPGVEEVKLDAEGIIVYTSNPTVLPKAIEGIPVKALSPLAPTVAGKPYQEVKAILERHEEEFMQLQGVESVWVGLRGIIVVTDTPAVLPATVEGIPVEPRVPPRDQYIGGKPPESAKAIFERHKKELQQLPGVEKVELAADGISVYTNNPAVLPTEVEGLPVKPRSPLKSGQQAQLPAPESQTDQPLHPLASQPEQYCGKEAHWDAATGRCWRNTPLASSEVKRLPPPPGVITLRPHSVRLYADSCPEGFQETVALGGWRFCLAPGYSEPLPRLDVPPIAGIPYEECLDILERHQKELMQLPGVNSVGLGEEGIYVSTSNPEVVPREVEGLPIKLLPPAEPVQPANHTINMQKLLMHGGLAVADVAAPTRGTLTHVALSLGKPWLIFPTHLLGPSCDEIPPCEIGTTQFLSQCPRAQILPSDPFDPHLVGTQLLLQPPSGPSRRVGLIQRWDPLLPGGQSLDVAAAYMDDNLVEGDGSLNADKVLESWQGAFTGGTGQTFPAPNDIVTVVSSNDPHILTAKVGAVNSVNVSVPVGPISCNGGGQTTFFGQVKYEVQNGPCFIQGDSGSPVVNAAGAIIAMFNWAEFPTPQYPNGNPCKGGGAISPLFRTDLGFDTWYGTNTDDLSVQVHPSFRTVMQGQGACAWAYIKNTGTVPAQNVAIQNTTTYAPQPTFDYYTPAGQWNIPYDIPAGQTAQFAVCMTLNQPQIPINWILNFYGTNAAAPVIKAAYNTFATRWTATPLPDPIVWTATLSNDDVVHTNGPSGTGLFTVTTWNNGATGNVTITLDTDWGYGGLPYTLWVCETNTQSQCFATPSPSLSLQMTAGSVHYFAVFPQGQGQPVTLDPYYHRIFFRIREGLNNPTGTLVGGAGLSITTN